jgi:hypothetical protein
MGSNEDDPVMISSTDSEIEISETDSDMSIPVQDPILVQRGMFIIMTETFCLSRLGQSDRKFLLVGPFIRGNASFDKHCIYGNDFSLNEYQVRYLKDLVKDYPGIPIKYYVYRMTNSSVIQKNARWYVILLTHKQTIYVPTRYAKFYP